LLIAFQSPSFEIIGDSVGEVIVALPVFLIGHTKRVARLLQYPERAQRASFHGSVERDRALGQKSMNEVNRHCTLADG
jgi:hypothetical protein